MTELRLSAVQCARERMREDGFTCLPSLVPSGFATALALSALRLPSHRVICGLPNVAWDEQTIPVGHLLYRLFTRGDVRAFVNEVCGEELAPEPQCWTSSYAAGEYINEHTDVTGRVQLLLSLAAPPPGHGGVLRFGPDGSIGEVLLAPGDGLLFLARQVVHATTPIVESEAERSPRRTVAVARYHSVAERAGASSAAGL